MNDSANQPERSSGFPRWLKWSLIGALAIVIAGYGAILVYAKVLNDSPDEFDRTDLDAALQIDDTFDTPADDATTDNAVADDTSSDDSTTDDSTAEDASAADDDTTTAAPAGDETVGGNSWQVTDESEVGYRVKEILFGVDTEAVGRTNQITGQFVISDTQVVSGEFVVDVASITSDESRRDGQFRGRIMSTDEFPEAVFTLTEPIEIGSESADGVEVETDATGELTLRGVTNVVTFDVTAQQSNGRIGVLGSIPVVFEDYFIANPSFGGVTTEDEGLLEFVLVFEPA